MTGSNLLTRKPTIAAALSSPHFKTMKEYNVATIQNRKHNQIADFLEACSQTHNLSLLRRILPEHMLDQLNQHFTAWIVAQNTLNGSRVNLDLARNRRQARYRILRKKAFAVRVLLRKSCNYQPALMRLLGVHPDQTPGSRRPMILSGHWTELVNSSHLVRARSPFRQRLAAADHKLCQSLEQTIDLYDCERVICSNLELDCHQARMQLSKARGQALQTFAQIRTCMKNAVWNGQPIWPFLQAIFFPSNVESGFCFFSGTEVRYAC